MLTTALAAVGWIDLAATVTLAGGLAYGALVGPPARGGRRALRLAVAMLALALAAEFVLTALRMEEVAGLGARALVVDLLAARWGRLWIARGLGLVLLGAALTARRPAWSLLASVAWLWLLLRSIQGHAGAHGMVAGLVDWLHLQAAAAWVGGLVQLALLPRPVAAATARRMRTMATGALALLIPGGVYLSVIHIQHLRMLTGSAYGWTLLAKLALAVPLLALGARNHFRHVPALERGDAEASPRLSRAVRLEIGIAAAILLFTAWMSVLPMPHLLPQ